ncbi:radical SAM protein [Desulfospira joergensenii]|uniref:radical SAM protein n=1 Tax=Desulfospira joergensenii TaxID=53329 RepID=UPI0005264B4E|nr:radical SAM protein [Desulfospira joergensenii]
MMNVLPAAAERLKRKWRQKLIRSLPGQVVIQVTDKCNAACPQCGMRISSDFTRKSLAREDVFKIIDAAGDRGVKAISFTGGEPLLVLDDLCAYMDRAGENGIPFIRTGTNGFLFRGSPKPGFRDRIGKLARQVAATPVRNFWISLDSCDSKIHERMRGFKGIVEGIEKALPIFHDEGLYPSANLGINRNLGGDLTRNLDPRDYSDPKDYEQALYKAYSKGFSKFYKKVIELGFTIANACYPMSVDPDQEDLEAVYAATCSENIVRFSQKEKKMIFKALKDTIPSFREKIRIFTPLASLDALIREYGGKTASSFPCQGGLNYHFIDSQTGNTFPCGYRGGENFGKYWHLNGKTRDLQPDCRLCDWECFRDPSELAGPVLDLFSSPLGLVKKTARDPLGVKTWARDLLYYRACGYFNGRSAPDYRRMSRV